MRRGFTGDAEQLAEDTRSELGISNFARLDAHRLAKHLEIPVWPLSTLPDRVNSGRHKGLGRAVQTLLNDRAGALSAMTVFRGLERVIVHNDASEPPRELSNLTHELAHGLLLHDPIPALDERGCRNWKTDIEQEAAYLGGTLIIPGKAARWCAKNGYSVEEIADKFGCSNEMVNWRLNASGARRLMR